MMCTKKLTDYFNTTSHKGKKLKGIKSAFFIGTPSTYKKGSVHLLHCCINGKSHVIICSMKRELDLHSWFNPSASKKYILLHYISIYLVKLVISRFV